MVLSMERGKVAVVTGASSGIGAAIATALVKEGLIVVGLARRLDNLKTLSLSLLNEPGKLHPIQCDVRSEGDICKAFQHIKNNYGPVHILINNAGVSYQTTLSDGDAEMWRAVLETNVLGLSIATREAIRDMKENKVDGHVIHINSILGHYVAFVPDVNMYSASKHAVTALTESLRQELLRSGTKIRISSVSPGPVDTEFLIVDKTVSSFPKLNADDVADATLYVLSTPPHVQSVSPGPVDTEFLIVDKTVSSFPKLNADDVADATIYVLSTPPHVQVQDVLVRPLGEPV